MVLDSRIKQFYRKSLLASLCDSNCTCLGNVTVYFPPKRAFHNLDKNFIESRSKELESYLQVIINRIFHILLLSLRDLSKNRR